MSNTKMRRAVAALATLAACVLLSGCAGEDARDAERAGGSAPTGGADAAAPATLVIQMTGLLLVTRPAQSGGPVHVLLPNVPSGMKPHVAWVGFPGDSSDLCERFAGGICYFDLDVWSLDSIGRGGNPASTGNAGLPPGALNVTHGSGNLKVDLVQARTRIRAHLILLAGEVTDSCSLAEWTYDPAGTPPEDTLSLVNVLEWTIRNVPRDELVLRLRTKPDSVRRIRADRLLIAHIPRDEIQDLPPSLPGPPIFPTPGTAAKHFHAFYNLLHPMPGSGQRPLPHFRRKLRSTPCEVDFQQDTALAGGIRTHSCMVATAETG